MDLLQDNSCDFQVDTLPSSASPMNFPFPDEEMFDDIHEGVAALRTAAGTHSNLSAKVQETFRKLEQNVPLARSSVRELKNRVKNKAIAAARKTDQAVQENPWVFSLGAFTAGILSGWLIARCASESNEDSASQALVD